MEEELLASLFAVSVMSENGKRTDAVAIVLGDGLLPMPRRLEDLGVATKIPSGTAMTIVAVVVRRKKEGKNEMKEEGTKECSNGNAESCGRA